MSGEHSPDLLATPRTRRQLLRAALAGAALTVPLARGVAPARAAGPHDCQKGCLFTAGKRWVSSRNDCDANLLQGSGIILFYPWLLFAGLHQTFDATRCIDRAILENKASSFDCGQPGCPGFNPSARGGPCEGCQEGGGVCCPDQNQLSGYACCTAPPGGCCKPDGCHSGITDCGG